MRALPVLLLSVLTILPPFAAGQATHSPVTVSVKETGCSGGATFCFEVTSGSLASVPAGGHLSITFTNTGNIPHNLYVADGADAAANKDTPASAAIAHTDTIGKEEEATLEVAVPSGVDALYFWCDEAGHESAGMWIETEVTAPADGDEENGGPVPAWLALVALLGAAVLLARRRGG